MLTPAAFVVAKTLAWTNRHAARGPVWWTSGVGDAPRAVTRLPPRRAGARVPDPFRPARGMAPPGLSRVANLPASAGTPYARAVEWSNASRCCATWWTGRAQPAPGPPEAAACSPVRRGSARRAWYAHWPNAYRCATAVGRMRAVGRTPPARAVARHLAHRGRGAGVGDGRRREPPRAVHRVARCARRHPQPGGDRGRALGRRRDPGPARVPRAADHRLADRTGADLPRCRTEHAGAGRGGARAPRGPAAHHAYLRPAAHPRRGAPARTEQCARRGSRRRGSAADQRGQSLLRLRAARVRRRGGAHLGARRRSRPGGGAARAGPARTAHDRAAARPRRARPGLRRVGCAGRRARGVRARRAAAQRRADRGLPPRAGPERRGRRGPRCAPAGAARQRSRRS